jgi:hypothetical protein
MKKLIVIAVVSAISVAGSVAWAQDPEVAVPGGRGPAVAAEDQAPGAVGRLSRNRRVSWRRPR